jgi:putative hydrolase of the HAD superfamily
MSTATLPPPNGIRAIVSDFIGVLTTPIAGVFTQFQEEASLSPDALREALDGATARLGVNPLFELECGRMAETDFLAALERELEGQLGRHVSMREFTDHYWAGLAHNEELVGFLRDARAAGYRLALLTNNVVEWEPRWRPKWPIDELFETVVDSGFVGIRKPDPAIFALTLERLGLPAEECVFIDDLEPNVVAAREVGLHAVHFRETDQAIGEVLEVLESA